jgi:hypothetical protein
MSRAWGYAKKFGGGGVAMHRRGCGFEALVLFSLMGFCAAEDASSLVSRADALMAESVFPAAWAP